MKRTRIFSLCLALLMVLSVFPAVPVFAADGYTVYLQSDSRWGSYSYGYYDAAATQPATISSSGCGLLALVNAVYYMQGTFIDPTFLADYSVNNGYRVNGTGTAHSLYSGFASDYGSTYGVSYVGKTTTWSTITSHLSGDGVAIFSVPNHLLAVVDYNATDGTYLVLDSAPSSNRGTDSDGTWLAQSQFTDKMKPKAMIMLEPHADFTPSTGSGTGTATEIWYVETSSGSALRMRSGPATTYDQVGSIPSGTSVSVTEIQNNWGKTTYNGVTGWFSLDYATYVSGSLESGITGTGTASDPYLIDSAADLVELANNCNVNGETYERTYFMQTTDIDLSGSSFTTIKQFNGIYDGAGFTISGLTMTGNDSSVWPNFGSGVGLFGMVDGGTLRGINIENFNLTGSYLGGGGAALVCHVNNATIYNCHGKNITADLSGGEGTAGGGLLIGKVDFGTSIDQCSITDSTLVSKGSGWMAGTGALVGATEAVTDDSNETSTISNCYAKNCSVTNKTTGATSEINTGLILGFGRQGTTLTNCWASGTVTAEGTGVGAIGKHLSGFAKGIFALNCTLTGAANYTNRVIGVSGDAYTAPDLSNLYALETATMNGQTMLEYIGGNAQLLPYRATSTNQHGEDITASEAVTKATYTNAGWSTNIWHFDGTNYPELRVKMGVSAGAGSGTVDDPYLISTVKDLIELANNCNNNGKTYENTYFKQVANINVAGTAFSTILNFNGIYDGGGYTISGLTQTADSSSTWPNFGVGVGVFGIVDGGTLKNIKIDSFNLSATNFGGGAGALVCHVNNATITNCHASNITADFSGGEGTAGGGILIGKVDYGTTVDQCSVTNSTLTSKAASWMAGTGILVGATDNVGSNGTNKISNCYVENCSVTNTIADASAEVDTGLILGNGRQGVSISNCWATGTVTATGTGAGVIGKQLNDSVSGVFALDNTITGAVNYVGRVIGVTGDAYTSPTLSNLYAVETVTMNGQTMLEYIGGNAQLLPYRATTDNQYGANITAAAAVQMSTYTTAGWSQDVWYFDGKTYPQLRAKTGITEDSSSIDGSGTENDPYIIDSVYDLLELVSNCNVDGKTYENTYFKQTANIDVSGTAFTTILKFNGIYDGGGYTISGLKQTADSSSSWPNFGTGIGVFGMVDGGTLKNICVDNFNLTGTNFGGGAGALVCHVNNATIENCHASNVTADFSGGDGTAGGGILVGKIDYGTTVSKCTVTDSTLVSKGSGWMAGTGALIGATEQVSGDNTVNTITNCYVKNCSVTNTTSDATAEVATGLILGHGRQGVSVSNCWATGTITASGTGVGVIGKQLTDSVSGVFALDTEFTGAANYTNRIIGTSGDAYTAPTLSNLYAVETALMNGQTMLEVIGGNAQLLPYRATTDNQHGANITTAQTVAMSTFTGAGWSKDIWYFDGENYPELRAKVPGLPENVEPTGDANGNDVVDTRDVIAMLRYILKWEGVTVNMTLCDMNQDGKITNRDVSEVLRLIAG